MGRIIGIDPGLTGAIAVLNGAGRYVEVIDIPVMAKGKGKSRVKNQVNCAELFQILREISDLGSRDCYAAIEEQRGMPAQASGTVFSLGDTFGVLRCALAGEGIQHEIITPRVWKSRFRLKGGDKDAARTLAIQLFPNAPLHLKKHHNRAEALLMAHYIYEQQNKLDA